MPRTLVKTFDIAIPAGTVKAAPLVTLTQFEPNEVTRIEWLFPSGCNGQVGIQIGARSVPVIPGDRTQFITRSGDSAGIDLEGMHTSGDWSVISYNTGAFPHIVHVTFHARRVVREPNPDIFILDDISLTRIGES
jgi:hypothetical protein